MEMPLFNVEENTDFVSFKVVGTPPGLSAWQAFAYGPFDPVQQTYPIVATASGTSDALVTLLAPNLGPPCIPWTTAVNCGAIETFVFFPSSTNESIDDVTVDITLAPEASSAILFLIAAVCAALAQMKLSGAREPTARK